MHADDFLGMVIEHEAEWDDYVSGRMSDHDAFECGIVDSSGYADSSQLDRAVARNPIPTMGALDNQLEHAERVLMTPLRDRQVNIERVINDAAIANLHKPRPTCSWCGEMMQPRDGRFGKFYFCECPEQDTVSDKYWQSVRIKETPKPILAKPPMSMQRFRTVLTQYTNNTLIDNKPNPMGHDREEFWEKARSARKELEKAYGDLLQYYETNMG